MCSASPSSQARTWRWCATWPSEAGLGEVPIVVGGIIPAEDVNVLKQCGASAVYTPKDFQLNDIMVGIVKLVDAKAAELAEASIPVPPLRARERVRL
jgi:(2R)-ethylmalonyl-CoA mutase